MRRVTLPRLAALLLLPVLFLANPLRAEPPALERPAPDFTLPAAVGTLSLSQYRGQVVLVDFWASWCAPCAQSFPWLDSLQRSLHDQGFTVVGVNVDKQRKKADAFLATHAASFPVAFDAQGVAAAAYALPGMPSSFLVDRGGILRRVHTGFRREECGEMEAAIRGLLAESVPAGAGE
jgi:peroxiredoxin